MDRFERLETAFPNRTSYAHLIRFCPFCGAKNISRPYGSQNSFRRCKTCRKQFALGYCRQIRKAPTKKKKQ